MTGKSAGNAAPANMVPETQRYRGKGLLRGRMGT